jgi:hypothetical protein
LLLFTASVDGKTVTDFQRRSIHAVQLQKDTLLAKVGSIVDKTPHHHVAQISGELL